MNVHIHFSSSVYLRNSMTPKILPTAGATVVAVWSLRRSWSNPSWRLVSETSCPGFCPNFATGSLLEHETHQVCRLTRATSRVKRVQTRIFNSKVLKDVTNLTVRKKRNTAKFNPPHLPKTYKIHDPLLNEATHDQPICLHFTLLTNPMRAIHCLHVYSWVPCRIQDDDAIGGGQIQAIATHFCGQKHAAVLWVRLKLLHPIISCMNVSLSIDSQVCDAQAFQDANLDLGHVQTMDDKDKFPTALHFF